jgi:hypothetical protein
MMNRNMMNSIIPAIGLGIALSVSGAWGDEAIDSVIPIEFDCQPAHVEDDVNWNCFPREEEGYFEFKKGIIKIALNMGGDRYIYLVGLELEEVVEPCLSVKLEEFEKKGESAIQLCDQEGKSVIVLPVGNKKTNQRRRGLATATCWSRRGFRYYYRRCHWRTWVCEKI